LAAADQDALAVVVVTLLMLRPEAVLGVAVLSDSDKLLGDPGKNVPLPLVAEDVF
jgi:hypothetical protein